MQFLSVHSGCHMIANNEILQILYFVVFYIL